MTESVLYSPESNTRANALAAAKDIADLELHFRNAHAMSGLEPKDGDNLNGHNTRMAEEARAMYDALHAEYGGMPDEALLELMKRFANNKAPNVTIGHVRMEGKWDAADNLWLQMALAGEQLQLNGYEIMLLGTDSVENQRIIAVDPQQTDRMGYIAATTKRLALCATKITEVVQDDGKPILMREVVEGHKRASFALDIKKLAEKNLSAAQEVRLIALAEMLRELDTEGLHSPHPKRHLGAIAGLFRLRDKMKEYKISADEVINRVSEPRYRQLNETGTIKEMISAILAREKGVLTPAATTMWLSREFIPLEESPEVAV
ncbi:MAG: hypothetical protein ACREGJ_01595 [Candidatus Saccharimonadales bacterium]